MSPSLLKKLETLVSKDALSIAADTSRLDHVTLILTVLGIILALGGVFAFYEIQHKVKNTAKTTAEKQVPIEVFKYMKENSHQLFTECLKDPEIIANLQIEFEKLGLTSTSEANEVDTDAGKGEGNE